MTNPKQNKEALGKGIRSLLQGIDSDLKTGAGSLKPAVVENVTGINRIPVDQVEPPFGSIHGNQESQASSL